ncbi:MAG: acetate--CoA ligase family protein [Clostridia bacterium]|nr:acetate--CoA ligase family protein [Clostridia bacterium]
MIDEMFSPKSAAVVGASNKAGKVGYAVLKNMIDSGYNGKLSPINPKDPEVQGLQAYKDIKDVPEAVDLVIITVPAKAVLPVVKDCAASGVKYLIIITAGFKEIGGEAAEIEQEMIRISKESGMRILGPNCLGLIDTHTNINASFAAVSPLKGDIAFLSQSGAMLVSILDWSRSMGFGFSKVVSMGNKADLCEIDFIEEAANDPYTKVILCYLEDINDGPRFLDVVSKASKKKPIIILKSGVSASGAKAASSHTGALAGSDLAYDCAFKQCGVIRVHTMTELFDLATVFSKCPLPKGDKVSIISNSGGPGIIATDNVEGNGLTVARYTPETLAALREGLPPESGINNPVDVLGDARTDRYQFALETVCKDPATDVVVILLCQTATTEPIETGNVLLQYRDQYPDKPFLAAYMGGEELLKAAKMLSDNNLPTYTFPEPAVSAVGKMVTYRKYKEAPLVESDILDLKVDQQKVKDIFAAVRKDNRTVLLGSEAAHVAAAYGIPAAAVELATSPEEAVKMAEAIGYPVVMKITSPQIMHKSDIGGVKVGLKNAEEVAAAFTEIMENAAKAEPEARLYGVEVNEMKEKGTELLIGLNRDAQFGPLVGCGMGGIYVNLMKDVSFRLVQGLTIAEIKNMLAETKVYTLLKGYRGEEAKDIDAVADAVGRVARLVADFPEIAELDVNPVFAYAKGLSAVDVKIVLS